MSSLYRFGAFELDAGRRRLLREGRVVAIQPQPLALLLYLIRQRDRVVSREELLAEVWSGVRVNAQAVGFAIHAARRALGDDGERQEVIRTVPRAGVQFVAAVEEVRVSPEGGEADPEIRPSGVRGLFLGRERLVAVVQGVLEEAVSGAGRVLLVSGEAGIGKTRALEQVALLAEGQGVRVLSGRCVESEGAPAFWPWVQILRAAVSEEAPPGLLRVLGEGARELAWMVPELRRQGAELPQAPSLDARAARFLMFDSVMTFLKELVGQTPHVLGIDDLHRADPASLALFGHVARELGDLPLVLVGTYREGELRTLPALAEPIAAVAALGQTRHESLRGLEARDVGVLVQGLSGHVPSKAVVADLHQQTNGNPFFVDQIVRVLGSEGRLGDLESAETLEFELPHEVQDAIRRQLRRLPERVRELLELASVIGREFTVGELEAASGLARRALLSRLGSAIEGGVIGASPGGVGGYRFVHALVRDAVYAGLPLEVRAQSHGRVARALESLAPEPLGPASAALAHHYAQSSSRGDLARAVECYAEAARWASSRGAFEEAPKHLARALELLAASGRGSEARRCRLLLQLGDALTNAGEREHARGVLQSAAALARQAGLHEEMARAALRFAPDFLAIETGVYDPELVSLLEGALASLEGSSAETSTAPLRARLLARLAVALHWNDDEEARKNALCDDARAIAERAGDPAVKDYVATAASFATYSVAHPERHLAPVSRKSATSIELELLQRLLRATALLISGQVREMDAEIQRFADAVVESRHPQAGWYVDLMRATRALMEGRYDQAAQLASHYLALGTRLGDRNASLSYFLQTLMSSHDTEGAERYEPDLRRIVGAFPRLVGWRAGFVLFLTEIGRLKEARRELRRLASEGALESRMRNEWYGTFGALALSCDVLGEGEVAESLYSRLLPLSNQFAVVGYCSYCVGSTRRLLAALASATKQWELAAEHFEAAISAHCAIGAHACNARTYFEYARMLKSAGRRKQSKEFAELAMTLASHLGMRRLMAKVESGVT